MPSTEVVERALTKAAKASDETFNYGFGASTTIANPSQT